MAYIIITHKTRQFDTVEEAELAAEEYAKSDPDGVIIAQVVGKVAAQVTTYDVKKYDSSDQEVVSVAEAVAATVGVVTP